jgi:ATP-binding cassette subfamily B protein
MGRKSRSQPKTKSNHSLSKGISPSAFHHLAFLKPYLAPYRFQAWLALLALSLAAFMVLILGSGVRYLIDHGFMNQPDLNLLGILLGLSFLVGLLALASFGRVYYVTWIGERVVTDLRQHLFNHVLKLDVSFYEQIRIGEIISRLTTDTSLIQVLLGNSAAIAIRNFLLFIGGVVMMVVISPKLTLICSLVVPLVVIPIVLFGRRVRRFSKLSQDRVADMSGYIDETLNNVRTVQSFTHEEYDKLIFQRYSLNAFTAAVSRTLARSILAAIVIIVVFSAIAAVLWIGAIEVSAERMTVGTLSSFIFYAVVVAGSAGSLSEILGDLQRAIGAADRLLELLKVQPAFDNPEVIRQLPVVSKGIVAIHNVSFAYPSNPRLVLKNITLSVRPGENLAIVGPSGVGKSTLFSLLTRFYDPQAGNIYFDGIDIKEVDLKDLRKRIAIVAQEPALFSASIYENILYGRPEASEQEVWQAADYVQLQNFLPTLPHGIHTIIGTKGVRLSGGQKQRISIARAILRNPSLLLLDEATNALDSESEQAVRQGLKHLISTRTTITIAHRFATVLNADRIIVFDQGGINGMGTHAELVSQNDLYRRLATIQFAEAEAFSI